MDKLISRMDQNQEMFERIVGDDLFGAVVREHLMKRLSQRFNG